MADLIYMTKAAWTAITDTVRSKAGLTGLLKAGDIPNALNGLFGISALLDGSGVTRISSPTVASIRPNCCGNFKSLKEVDIPAAKTINQNAFDGCTSLTRLNAPKATYIYQSAFANGPAIKNMTLPKAESIQQYAFELQPSYQTAPATLQDLGKLTLGNIRYIGVMAFDLCGYSEVDITVNANGGSIATQAFNRCLNLKKVTIRGKTMLTNEEGFVFYGSPIESLNGEIFVDASLVESYKTATNWSNYASIIKAVS